MSNNWTAPIDLIPAADVPIQRREDSLASPGENQPLPGLVRVPSLPSLLRAFSQVWLPAIVIGGVLGTLAAATDWMLRPDKSTASLLLKINQEEYLLPESTPRPGDNKSFAGTQVALLKSRAVLRACLADDTIRRLPTLANRPDPVEWLEKELKVDKVPDSELVQVSLSSRGNAADLAPIVNKVVAAYFSQIVEQEKAQHLAHINELKRAYAIAETKLRDLRASYKETSKSVKGTDSKVITLRQTTMINEFATVKRDLTAMNTRQRELDLKISSLKQKLEATANKDPKGQEVQLILPPNIEARIDQELDSDPKVVSQDLEVEKIRKQIAAIDAVTKDPASQAKQDLNRQLSAAVRQYETIRLERRKVIAVRYQSASREFIRSQLDEATNDMAVLMKQRPALEAEVNDLSQKIETLGLESVELELKLGEIERTEQFLKSIWNQKERLELEHKQSSSPRVKLISEADPAVVLSKYGRAMEAFGVGTVAFLFGVTLVSLIEFRKGKIRSVEDVSFGLKMRVLGTLPQLPFGPTTGLGLKNSDSQTEVDGQLEAIDGIRTIINHELRQIRCATVMINSPSPSEGKTTLAVQLADSFARAGFRTLLIDGDFRVPTLHRHFGLSESAGMSELLNGASTESDIIQPTSIPGLSVICAGHATNQTFAMLAQFQMLRVINSLREQFDYIVLDSSPLLVGPDSHMLARFADTVILSARPGVTESSEFFKAFKQLMEHQHPVLGVVINGVKLNKKYTGYSYRKRGSAITGA